MDSTKVAVVGIIALAGLFTAALGLRFVADHWEDIKALAIVALVVGGTLTLAVGGFKLKSGR